MTLASFDPMTANPRFNKALALEPIDSSTADEAPARPAADEPPAAANAQRELRMTTSDEFLAAAAKEYEAGKIDPALWGRARDQCNGDASLVIAAYLRARAKVLELRHKANQSSQIQSRGTGSKPDASDRNSGAEFTSEIAARDHRGIRVQGKIRLLYLVGAVAALAAAAALVYLVISPKASEPVPSRTVPVTTPSSKQSDALGPEVSVVNGVGGGGKDASSKPMLSVTVQQLKNVGNWNLLVLYATEWTRQEPSNGVAWNELSAGYAKLRQFNDALDAANKAVQLSPGDPIPWRNLGQINLAVDRLPEAGTAFDRALALNPDDVAARCGAALVAQRQARPKDADAISMRVRTADGSCPDVGSGGSTTVPAGESGARKPASSAGR